MLRTRVMPCLLLRDSGLVKTVRFKKPDYVGDPVNIVRIFNEFEVDELILLDIKASASSGGIQWDILQDVFSECFMPVTYGGGLSSVADMARVFSLGAEKCVLNTGAFENPGLITEAADRFGSQSLVVSIDVRKGLMGGYRAYSQSGGRKHPGGVVEWAKRFESAGAGELMVTSIDREGSFGGYDVELIKTVSEAVDIPVIANGGASCVDDFKAAVFRGGASAVAAGSMVVYQGSNRAVLTNFPPRKKLDQVLKRSLAD